MSPTHYDKVVLSSLREQVFLQRIIGLQGKYRLIQCIFLNCTLDFSVMTYCHSHSVEDDLRGKRLFIGRSWTGIYTTKEVA
jgi:hypothetical protein